MLKPEQIQLLEDYKAGFLSPEGCLAVEQNILADSDLGQEAMAYLELFDGFKGLELEAFEQCLHTWESKYKEEATTAIPVAKVVPIVRFFSKYRFAVAAVILVLLMPLGYYIVQGVGSSEEALFASNFEPYKPFIDTKTRALQPTNSADPVEAAKIARALLLAEGIDAYNRKKYTVAIQHLSQFLEIAPIDENLDEVRVYLGVANLIEDNTTAAKQIFEEVLTNGKTSIYLDASEWYMALTLLKEKDTKQAKKALQKIANAKKHRYKHNASKLLPKLEQYK